MIQTRPTRIAPLVVRLNVTFETILSVGVVLACISCNGRSLRFAPASSFQIYFYQFISHPFCMRGGRYVEDSFNYIFIFGANPRERSNLLVEDVCAKGMR